jgi:hypothetical protein
VLEPQNPQKIKKHVNAEIFLECGDKQRLQTRTAPLFLAS